MGDATTRDLPEITEALFATISYRLEPGGRGTRFPILMRSLDAGAFDPKDATAALLELAHVEAGLRELPPDRVVWSVADLRRIDDTLLPVNHAAANAYEYFVAQDGRPLLAHVRERIQQAMSDGRGATFVIEDTRSYAKARLFGLAIAILSAGMIYYDWYLLNTTGSYYPKLAVFGPVCLAGGLFMLLFPRQAGPATTTRQTVLLVLGFAISVLAGVFNLYLMGFFSG